MTTLRQLKTSKPREPQGYAETFLLLKEGGGAAAKTIRVKRQLLNILLSHPQFNLSRPAAAALER